MVKSDSIRESANPAPGIFLAKARGTPASIASFRDYATEIGEASLNQLLVVTSRKTYHPPCMCSTCAAFPISLFFLAVHL